MNAARLYKKTAEEDLLTSDVFGLLKYLSPPMVLWPLLRVSKCFHADSSSLGEKIQMREPSCASYFFWPDSPSGQPDLLILASNTHGESAAVAVEVKYTSKKHNLPNIPLSIAAQEVPQKTESRAHESDQLSRYLIALFKNEIRLRAGDVLSPSLRMEIETDLAAAQLAVDSVEESKRFLLYLTDDCVPPEEEIGETLAALHQSPFAVESKDRLFWVSWRALYDVVEQAVGELGSVQAEIGIVRSILRTLDLWDLFPFRGWSRIYFDKVDSTPLRFWNPWWFRDLRIARVDLPVLQFWQRSR